MELMEVFDHSLAYGALAVAAAWVVRHWRRGQTMCTATTRACGGCSQPRTKTASTTVVQLRSVEGRVIKPSAHR